MDPERQAAVRATPRKMLWICLAYAAPTAWFSNSFVIPRPDGPLTPLPVVQVPRRRLLLKYYYYYDYWPCCAGVVQVPRRAARRRLC